MFSPPLDYEHVKWSALRVSARLRANAHAPDTAPLDVITGTSSPRLALNPVPCALRGTRHSF